MADRRKLQGEIDRCLKKVAEGVETFEDIWQKVHNATNANQKEKYEADLKKEIKKLQRLRDQIKTWCASSEIKDKRQLVDNRKLIETQMERFKVVERETKTKAYSKEGLGAVQKLDPVQKERDEITNWLSASIDTLSVQVDQFESEIEALQVVQKKSKKDRDKHERNDFLKNRVEKHRYHIKQLETLMRMLDNETVEVDDIKKIKDDIEYYIESSQDAEFQDNEYIYDDLDLEDMKAFRANNVVDSNLALAKSSSTTSASKDANTSSNTASVDNEDIPNAQSNPSSANESPAPSPGLPNTHSTNSTGKAINTPVPQEFSFISSSPSTTTTTTNTLSTTPPATNKPVWTSSSVVTSKAPPPSSTPSSSVASTPYAAAVASLASASAKVVMSNELANDPRLQANSGTLSFADSSVNHHSIAPPTSAVVTLYAAAAAAASSVTATAPVSTNAWSSTASGPNPAEVPTNHQLLNARQLSNASQIPLTPQQQQMLMQQQQQQQNNHLMNGFKVENQSIANLKTLAQQTVTSSGLDEQMDNSLIMSNLTNMTTSNGSNANSINPINLLNDLSNSGSNATLNSTMPMDPSSMFKNNLLVHQRNSQLMQAANSPAASASPPSNLMGTPSVPSNVNSGGNISSSDNMASSNAVGVGTLTNLINAAPGAPVNPNPTQVFFQAYSNQVNKSALPKQFYIHMHLLDSAYRHPIIPLDSHRLKPLTKMIPSIQTAFSGSHLPNQILPQFDNLEFYKRLTPETLFFIFYYMEGTRAQYLAAKTLKIKSWRFHTKFMMWFQRLEEPKVITDDYEQGTYIFFDFNKWSQQKKEGFVFEYKYLEDKELN